MTSIAVDGVTEGAVLAADVKDAFGRVLMRSGTALEQQHIQTLRKCGIVEVHVTEATVIGAAAGDGDPAYEEMDRRMAPLFARIDTEWDVMRIIRRTAVLQALQRGAVIGEHS